MSFGAGINNTTNNDSDMFGRYNESDMFSYCGHRCSEDPFLIVNLIVCVVIIAINICSLYVLFSSTSFRESVPGKIMINLGFADSLVGICCLPFHFCFLQERLRTWTGACIAGGLVFNGCLLVSMMSLAHLAVDRQLAICYPLRYDNLAITRHCRRLLAISWVIGFGIQCTAMHVSIHEAFCVMPFGGCTINYFHSDLIYTNTGSAVIFILSTAMIGISFTRIWKVIRRMRQTSIGNFPNRPATFMMTRTSFIIIGAFLICWIPSTANLVAFFITHSVVRWLYDTAHFAIMCNGFLNPIVYGITNNRYKNAVLARCGRKRSNSTSLSKSRNSTHRSASRQSSTLVSNAALPLPIDKPR